MIRLLYDQVLIKEIKQEVTLGGIYLPCESEKETLEGHVITVGKGKRLDNGAISELTVRQGDRVVFKSDFATTLTVDGESYYLISEDDVLAILE